jgi:hypothetical protein
LSVNFRLLDKRAELRQDMVESSAWMFAESITAIQKAAMIRGEERTAHPLRVPTVERG